MKDDSYKDLIEAVVSVRRVSKTTRGGNRFSFSTLVLVGDQEGRVGISSGKDKELNNAKIKAARRARAKMVHIPLRYGRTIHHDIKVKYKSSLIIMRSAKIGSGIIAGGVLRNLCECLGVKDIVIKAYGSSNNYNMLNAAMQGFMIVNNPKKIAERRGVKTKLVIEQKNSII